MKGKDWFIVGTRLIGLGILYLGFQQAITYVTRGMLFANLERSFFLESTPPWMHLLNGALTGAFALVLLMKADALADWCYGKEKPAREDHDYDEDDHRDADASEDSDFEAPPSIKKSTP